MSISNPCEVHGVFFLSDRKGGMGVSMTGFIDQTAACALFCNLCTGINVLKQNKKDKKLRPAVKVLKAMYHRND